MNIRTSSFTTVFSVSVHLTILDQNKSQVPLHSQGPSRFLGLSRLARRQSSLPLLSIFSLWVRVDIFLCSEKLLLAFLNLSLSVSFILCEALAPTSFLLSYLRMENIGAKVKCRKLVDGFYTPFLIWPQRDAPLLFSLSYSKNVLKTNDSDFLFSF